MSVIIPTYRRPEHLKRCLTAVAEQLGDRDEAVVVRRVDDNASARMVEHLGFGNVRCVQVREPGQIAALLAGTRASEGKLIAFTDDDAVPHPHWLDGIKAHFTFADVGAAGGRDLVRTEPKSSGRTDVGRITRWGKLIGNHHLGLGPARDVMVLKGVNMAFRRGALTFPLGLRGRGAEVHQEISMCLACLHAGWRVVYDPKVTVDHFPAPRFDRDRRVRPSSSAIRDAAYNYVISILTWRRDLLWRRTLFGIIVGDRAAPGLLRACAAVPRGERDVLVALCPSLFGQVQALIDIVRGRVLRMTHPDGAYGPAAPQPTGLARQ